VSRRNNMSAFGPGAALPITDPAGGEHSSDGVVARSQIARVLVRSQNSAMAQSKTFELVAERGDEQPDLDAVFARLRPDLEAAMDGVADTPNMPLAEEPEPVRSDLLACLART
jgi:hypothetical protein